MPQRYHDNEDEADASSCDESAPLSLPSAANPHWFRRLTARRNILPFFLALLATLVLVLALTLLTALDSSPQRKIVILMVSDGMGPASLSMARTFRQYTQDLEYSAQLPLDPYFVGTSRTRSYDRYITDSAAGATAFSCGIKTYNRAIGVDPLKRPCGTVLEAAKRQGYLTGMVVTAKVTDATPASFASHVSDRQYENAIAEQLVGNGPLNRTVDVLFGGGLCHFMPKGEGSCRTDNLDLLSMAKDRGFTFLPNRDALSSPPATFPLPALGLFAPGHMSYSIDRNHTLQPSLAEMTHFALEALDANSENGFFLLIEGSRIDLASHSNDPVGHIHDVLAFNAAFDVARLFAEQTPGAVLISTSDHETGGISIGRQVGRSFDYFWFPEVLANASHSTEFLGRLVAENGDEDIRPFLEKVILEEGLGIVDATEEELAALIERRKYPIWADLLLADMISLRARIGYSTHGHTAVDVNIYAAGDPLARETLRGNHENTEIGGFIREYLDLDLQAVTEILNAKTDRFEGVDTLGDEQDEFLVQREIDRRHH